MIDAHDVGETRVRRGIAPPTSIIRLAKDVPAIERIAPSLAGLAEVIGRNAGDDVGSPCSSSWKISRFAQTSALSAGDVDRDVAHDLNAALVRRLAHGSPLREEEPLDVFMKADLVRKLFLRRGHRVRLARDQRGRPRSPRRAAVALLQ